MQIQDFLSSYKGIYLINNSFNNTFGKVCIPFFKMIVILTFVTSFFAFLRLYQDLELLPLFLVVVLVITAPPLAIPMSIVMSSLYDLSSKFNRYFTIRIQHIATNKTRKLVFQGQLKSCFIIRCQVGNFYYMEGKAKLTLIHNVLNGIVFLMVNAK